MIIDTSALSAIFFGEPEGDVFIRLIDEADRCRMSRSDGRTALG